MSQSHARTNLIRSIPERNEHKRRGKEEVKRRGKRVKNRRSILAAIARDLCLNRPALHLPLERETPRKKEKERCIKQQGSRSANKQSPESEAYSSSVRTTSLAIFYARACVSVRIEVLIFYALSLCVSVRIRDHLGLACPIRNHLGRC
jgi:hypothetical protein